jgi:MFS family permease
MVFGAGRVARGECQSFIYRQSFIYQQINTTGMAQVTEREQTSSLTSVISSSSVGTLIEWYDFYIFGSLAGIISAKFFPPDNPTAAFLSTLATFAAGFIVRPFGALFFGRLGDLVGRKYTFLVTLALMGVSTFLIGCIPGYETIGAAAPILMLLLRLLQGLALGGEYGGAATYVAEHSPDERRGYFTSWIQTTATLGLFISIGVILGIRSAVGVAAFTDFYWRVPFLLSILLVIVSIIIRLRMSESPLFNKIKKEGTISKNPLAESFGKKENLKMVLLALFGAVCGQGVVWYTGQFYAQFFLEGICKLDFETTRTIMLWAITLSTPFFIVFGALSDKLGRKWIILGGMLLAIVAYRPIYQTMLDTSKAAITGKQEVSATPAVKIDLIKDTKDSLFTTTTVKKLADGTVFKQVDKVTKFADTTKTSKVDKPAFIDIELASGDYWKIVMLITVMIIFVTMVYGPIAAFLVELFPTRIRYTSMSLPYHIGNGVFGGLVPFIGTLIVELTKSPELPNGDPLAGLWYPIGVATLCFIIGALYLPKESHKVTA